MPPSWHLRLEALEQEPLAFGMSSEEHRATTVHDAAERLDDAHSGAITFGAFSGTELVGIATLLREVGNKERHKAHLVGVYLRTAVRGRGLGARLLQAVLDDARTDGTLEQVLLGVRVGNTQARRLYESLGFRGWGVEPSALKVGTDYVNEEQMILFLRR